MLITLLLLAAAALTSCHPGAQHPSSAVPPSPDARPSVFVETVFAAIPREALATLTADDARELISRRDSTVYSGGGALLELRDDFVYVPSPSDATPGGDLLETGSRNLRVGLRPRQGTETEFDLRLESQPSFERSVLKTALLKSSDSGLVIDTQLAHGERILVLLVRAQPVHGRADLERIYARKLAERTAAREAR
jgi:hypothetical protein